MIIRMAQSVWIDTGTGMIASDDGATLTVSFGGSTTATGPFRTAAIRQLKAMMAGIAPTDIPQDTSEQWKGKMTNGNA